MGWPGLILGQLLPVDPQVAIDATRQAYEGFRKDFIVATTVALVLSHLIWIVAYGRLLRHFHTTVNRVQEARVDDQKEATKRIAIFMDKSAESLDLFMEAQRQGKL